MPGIWQGIETDEMKDRIVFLLSKIGVKPLALDMGYKPDVSDVCSRHLCLHQNAKQKLLVIP